MPLQQKRTELAKMLADLRRELLTLLGTIDRSLEQYQSNAFEDILNRLIEMEKECRRDKLQPKDQRYRYVARTVVETDPDILPPELGGRLIEVEDIYRKL